MNFIEKRLPRPVRDNLRTLIAAGLGLFLGLQYNDYLKAIINNILPESNNLLVRGVILFILTIMIVYVSIFVQKGLDGK